MFYSSLQTWTSIRKQRVAACSPCSISLNYSTLSCTAQHRISATPTHPYASSGYLHLLQHLPLMCRLSPISRTLSPSQKYSTSSRTNSPADRYFCNQILRHTHYQTAIPLASNTSSLT